MFSKLRMLAFLAIAAPMPVLIHLGLRDETGAITPTGAAAAFGLALLAGFVLFNFIRGLMRLPILLIGIGLAVVLLGSDPQTGGPALAKEDHGAGLDAGPEGSGRSQSLN